MNSWVNVERPHFDLRSIAIPHAFMTSAGSALGIVTLLQTCWLSLSKGNLPSPDVLSLLLSKVILPSHIQTPPLAPPSLSHPTAMPHYR